MARTFTNVIKHYEVAMQTNGYGYTRYVVLTRDETGQFSVLHMTQDAEGRDLSFARAAEIRDCLNSGQSGESCLSRR